MREHVFSGGQRRIVNRRADSIALHRASIDWDYLKSRAEQERLANALGSLQDETCEE